MMINTFIFAYPVGRTFLTEITEGKEAEDDKLQTPVSHSHTSFQLSFITLLLSIFSLYTTWLFRLVRVSLYRRWNLTPISNVCKEAPRSLSWTSTQWRIQGEGPGGPAPPSFLLRPDACLRLKFLRRQDRISLSNWVIFFLATKLNSRDIQKCDCFWLPSTDMFASAHKAVFPAPTATSVHRLRNTSPSLWKVICHKKVQRSFLNQSLDLPQSFLDPLLQWKSDLNFPSTWLANRQ